MEEDTFINPLVNHYHQSGILHELRVGYCHEGGHNVLTTKDDDTHCHSEFETPAKIKAADLYDVKLFIKLITKKYI